MVLRAIKQAVKAKLFFISVCEDMKDPLEWAAESENPSAGSPGRSDWCFVTKFFLTSPVGCAFTSPDDDENTTQKTDGLGHQKTPLGPGEVPRHKGPFWFPKRATKGPKMKLQSD